LGAADRPARPGGRSAGRRGQRIRPEGVDRGLVGPDHVRLAGPQRLDLVVQVAERLRHVRRRRLDDQDPVRPRGQVGVGAGAHPAVDEAAFPDGDRRPHPGHRATGRDRVHEVDAGLPVEHHGLAGDRVDGRDQQGPLGPLRPGQAGRDRGQPDRFGDGGGGERQRAQPPAHLDRVRRLVGVVRAADRRGVAPEQVLEVDVHLDLGGLDAQLGVVEVGERGAAGDLGAHRRAGRGADDQVGRDEPGRELRVLVRDAA
jgi:hypothetical protein